MRARNPKSRCVRASSALSFHCSRIAIAVAHVAGEKGCYREIRCGAEFTQFARMLAARRLAQRAASIPPPLAVSELDFDLGAALFETAFVIE